MHSPGNTKRTVRCGLNISITPFVADPLLAAIRESFDQVEAEPTGQQIGNAYAFGKAHMVKLKSQSGPSLEFGCAQ